MAIHQDCAEVLSIENSCFEFPWSKEEFFSNLEEDNCVGMVAEKNHQIVGFMVYELGKTVINLLNFAVAPEYRRQGIGRQMAELLIAKLYAVKRSTRIAMKVGEKNLAAQLFFRACGFKAVNVFHNIFQDTPEDAYLMVLRKKLLCSAR
jgi:ribosomal-protein-alanine N-acetyltransferase